MKITNEMLKFINMAMDEAFKKAYPKTGGNAHLQARVTEATIKGLRSKEESILSRALFFATQPGASYEDLKKENAGLYTALVIARLAFETVPYLQNTSPTLTVNGVDGFIDVVKLINKTTELAKAARDKMVEEE